MLTSFQCSTVAYTDEFGELFCPECAEKRANGAPRVDLDGLFLHLYGVLDPEATGLSPVIQYALDEEAAARGESYPWDEADGLDHAECEPSIDCDECGKELVGEYHYGHEGIEPRNVPVPRWVPCRCGAGDGEMHAQGCREVVSS